MFFSEAFVAENSWNGYENNCLFANRGGGRFVDIARPTGVDGVRDARGVAVADFNGDGRLDLAINNNNAAPYLYLNRAPGGNWSAIRLVGGPAVNRDSVGAVVSLTAGGKTLRRVVEAGSGYASQAQRALHFGLGAADRIEAIHIAWPNGQVERFEGSELRRALNRVLTIRQGEGRVDLGDMAAAQRQP